MQFEGKCAFVTGAASGMGLKFSESWAAEGGCVLMCDINGDVLREKAEEIGRKGPGRAEACLCDVRDYAQITAARDRAVEAFGSIDLSVSFAGGTAVRVCQVDREAYPEFPDVPIEVFDWGIDVNLRAQLYVAHAVMAQMRKQGSGLVVNIGSVWKRFLRGIRRQCRWHYFLYAGRGILRNGRSFLRSNQLVWVAGYRSNCYQRCPSDNNVGSDDV